MNTKTAWKRLRRTGLALKQWAGTTWPVWLFLGSPAVFGAILISAAPSMEAGLRVYGVALQVAGLLVIMHGLSVFRRKLRPDGQGFVCAIAASFGRLWQILSGERRGVSIPLEPGSARARGRELLPQIGPNDMESRLAQIEREVAQLRQDLKAAQRGQDGLEQRLSEDLAKQVTWRDRIDSAHLDGLTLEIIAVVWIGLGLVLASLPDWAPWLASNSIC